MTTYTPAPAPKPAATPAPKEIIPPEEGTIPFSGGANAKVGGAYPGGWVPEAPDPPPEGDTRKK